MLLEQIMSKKTWLALLKNPKIDASDFILILLDLLKTEKVKLKDPASMNKLLEAIQIDYLELNYHDSVKKLKQAAKLLPDPALAQLIEKNGIKAMQNGVPEQLESRRYFENRFVVEEWNSLSTEAYYESLERLGKFMTASNPTFSEKEDFSKLKKLGSLRELEIVISAVRGYDEETKSFHKVVSAFRYEKNSLSMAKDRGKGRAPEDVGETLSPGIVKANQAMPKDELRETPVRSRVTDSVLIDRTIKDGYSATQVNAPFVNSVSGTTYALLILLIDFAKVNASSPYLQQDVDNIVQTFVSYTCKMGFHSLPEMLDVIRSKQVTDLFKQYHLKINYHFSQETLDKALHAASKYTETKELHKKAMTELIKHSMFKKYSTPPMKEGYPRELSRYLRVEKQTGPKVAIELEKMYQQGLSGNEKYSAEHCKAIAEQYLHFVKTKHLHSNIQVVRNFVYKMDAVIEGDGQKNYR